MEKSELWVEKKSSGGGDGKKDKKEKKEKVEVRSSVSFKGGAKIQTLGKLKKSLETLAVK